MDTWVWLVIIAAVALALFAVAWRSSGRARLSGRGPENSLTQEQIEQLSLNQIKNQAGPRGPF